jgi:phosphopantothenoylcysteine synthetase/decarboxylase
MPRIIITAGPTSEPVDQVRRLTNFSTGSLGTQLAEAFTRSGHEVVLLRSLTSTAPMPSGLNQVIPFETTDELANALQNQASLGAAAVCHAAAVSDFKPGGVFLSQSDGQLEELVEGKISSQLGNLMMKLIPCPKILPCLRDWFPESLLIGWKYEVEGDSQSLLTKVRHQLQHGRTNLCVLNGPALGKGFEIHGNGGLAPVKLDDHQALCEYLLSQVGTWKARPSYNGSHE